MSLINQVLNDLEKRGASTHIGETTVRVVPLRQERTRLWLLLAGAALLILGAAAWLQGWIEIRIRPAPAATANAPVVIVPQKVQQAATSTSPIEAASAVSPAAVKNTESIQIVANQSPAAAPVPAAAKSLAIQLPVIAAVSPNPAITLGVKQALTVSGQYFAKDATIKLRTPQGNIYANQRIVMQDASRIVISANLADIAGSWSVEVKNGSGHLSGRYDFMVQAAPPSASAPPQNKSAAAKKIPEPRVAKPEPAAIAEELIPAAGVSKQPTQITPYQQAENEFRKAYALMQQRQTNAAISGYEAALKLDASHLQARQTLVNLLLANKRNAEAERLLQEGLQLDARQTGLALLLARMQVGRNELAQALETMQKSLPHAQQQADYQAFVAALLQRQNKHKEAITYFQHAVQLSPQSGVWLMGLGISLRAEQRRDEARDAFSRALDTHSLSAELNTYVTQQLKEL